MLCSSAIARLGRPTVAKKVAIEERERRGEQVETREPMGTTALGVVGVSDQRGERAR